MAVPSNYRQFSASDVSTSSSVLQAIIDRGYLEDVFLSNVRIALGLAACAVALVAQFYPLKFPANVTLLVVCIAVYVLLNVALQYMAIVKEKNHILFTHPKTVRASAYPRVAASRRSACLPRISLS
jgi:hypothetical protein